MLSEAELSWEAMAVDREDEILREQARLAFLSRDKNATKVEPYDVDSDAGGLLSLSFSTKCAESERRLRDSERLYAGRQKALSRFFAGAQFEKLLLVTLTTPEGFDGSLHRAWRLFTWRLRKRGLMRNYFAVREWNEKHSCEHIHAVFQTRDTLEVKAIREQWTLACGSADCWTLTERGWVGRNGLALSGKPLFSCWTKHEWARDKGKMGAYLAKYLVKAVLAEPRKRTYWYALGWVFAGFARWSKGMWACGNNRSEHIAWLVRLRKNTPEQLLLMAREACWRSSMPLRSIGAFNRALEAYRMLDRSVCYGS